MKVLVTRFELLWRTHRFQSAKMSCLVWERPHILLRRTLMSYWHGLQLLYENKSVRVFKYVHRTRLLDVICCIKQCVCGWHFFLVQNKKEDVKEFPSGMKNKWKSILILSKKWTKWNQWKELQLYYKNTLTLIQKRTIGFDGICHLAPWGCEYGRDCNLTK